MKLTTLSSILALAGAVAGSPSVKRTPAKDDVNATLPAIVPVNTRANNQELISKLLTAPTQSERFKLLNQPGDFIFDFNNRTAPEGSAVRGKGGVAVAATAKTFPALIGNGAAMIVGFLGPCGMNTPHVHNRGTELAFVAEGRLVINFVGENGVTPVANTVTRFQMAIFPQGSIHTQFNPDCTNAMFVAGFNNADPGTTTIAQNFFQLRPDIVNATLGLGPKTLDGADIETFRKAIPANIALGIDACLAKCGIKRNVKRDLGDLLAQADDA
ncbi:spherulin-1A [Moelleriella libera RCEF 2490]|uniref:Spherulin-1A n=1 Tax=Moelleriella libera RCEF 2490 TaxID=1081109 RepID=A0A168BP49_9HYPO|nr:spherulin-1A [Moelleriella libera RCEF 2490]